MTAATGDNEPTGEPPARKRTIEWFADRDGVELHQSGIMSRAMMNPEVIEQVELSALGGGARSRVLFRGDGPHGFSLVDARRRRGA